MCGGEAGAEGLQLLVDAGWREVDQYELTDGSAKVKGGIAGTCIPNPPTFQNSRTPDI